MFYDKDVDYRYQHDTVFRQIVDQMRMVLKAYYITPAELREAAMLAATMHMCEEVPRYMLTFPLDGKPDDWVYRSDAMYVSPSLFGGGRVDPRSTFCIHGAESGRIQSSKPNVSNVPKNSFKCICGKGDSNVAAEVHKQTCRDYNWAFYRPKSQHTWGKTMIWGIGERTKPYRVCSTCGLSDVYAGDTIPCKA